MRERPMLTILTNAGPDVFGISNDVTEGCTVEQAAYVVRHGSRFPDNGAYKEWVALFDKVSNGRGTLSRSVSDEEIVDSSSAVHCYRRTVLHPILEACLDRSNAPDRPRVDHGL